MKASAWIPRFLAASTILEVPFRSHAFRFLDSIRKEGLFEAAVSYEAGLRITVAMQAVRARWKTLLLVGNHDSMTPLELPYLFNVYVEAQLCLLGNREK